LFSAPTRLHVAAIAGCASLVSPVPALADVVDECVDASDRGQLARDRGGLIEARELFVRCARSECPAVMQRDCAEWLTSVESRLPSIVLRARDRRGRDVVDVGVYLDDEKIADRLDGRAITLDPGAHTLRFAHATAPAIEQRLLVAEGDKGRRVEVTLALGEPESATPPPAAPPRVEPQADPASGKIPAASFVLGGIGLLGIAGFAYFGVTARNDRDDLERTCAPDCDQADVDAVRTRVIVADVSLGVGVLALAGAFWIGLDASANRSATTFPASRLTARPTRGGAIGFVEFGL
jgi:hypothetical protein